MKFTFNTKNYHINSNERDMIEKKLNRLDKFFREDAEATITIKPRKIETSVEITIISGSTMFRAEKDAENALSAVDEGCEALERQLRKNKTRLEKRFRDGLVADVAFDAQNPEEQEDINLIRTKSVQMKPMLPDDAILQMNLVGHDFFMFFNIETSTVCVVYKRKEGGYGLLEPEF